MIWIAAWCLVGANVGCSDPEPDQKPKQKDTNNTMCTTDCDGPSLRLLAGDQQVWSRTMLEASSTPVQAMWPWSGGYLVKLEGEVKFWSPYQGIRDFEVDVDLNGQDVVMAAHLDETHILVATAQNLLSIGPEGLQPSPLNDHFKGKLPKHIQPDATSTNTVWLANDDAIFMWRDGSLFKVETNEAPTTKTKLSIGPAFNDNPTIWASTEDVIYAIEFNPTDNSFVLHLSRRDRGAQAIAASREGLWAISNGEVLYRDGAKQWQTLKSDRTFVHLRANPKASGVWLIDNTDRVWHLQDEQLTDLPDVKWTPQAYVDSNGRLLVLNEGAITRYDRRLAVEILGLNNETALSETTTINLEMTFPQSITEAKALVGETVVEIDLQNSTLTLDPATIGQGQHQLSIALTYDNVKPQAKSTQRFAVADFDVSWSTHIKPIYEASCALAKCHGEQSIHPLTQPMLWQDEFDNILVQLKQGTMPLPPFAPVTASEVKLLEAWQAQGFKKD